MSRLDLLKLFVGFGLLTLFILALIKAPEPEKFKYRIVVGSGFFTTNYDIKADYFLQNGCITFIPYNSLVGTSRTVCGDYQIINL